MSRDIMSLLDSIESGEELHADELLPVVYSELRSLASAYLSGERTDHTLQPTALVHEAYVKLVGTSGPERTFDSREHFIRAAAESMRRILVDSARTRGRLKRGGDRQRVQLEFSECVGTDRRDQDLLDVHDALLKLADVDSRAAKLVELRFFGGQSMDSAAAVLEISVATAERDWAYARAWLNDFINKSHGETD